MAEPENRYGLAMDEVRHRARILFEACPLCESTSFGRLRDASCQGHSLYDPSLPPMMRWMKCRQCDHVFTDGYFDAESNAVLMSKPDAALSNQVDPDAVRYAWARTVREVARLAFPGSWLDVGVGSGALARIAREWGYSIVGVDTRHDAVSSLQTHGIECREIDFLDLGIDESFDIVSMFDVLEHLPRPRAAIAQAFSLLKEGGLLVVSTPNSESFSWHEADANGANIYWSEIEHYHNFSRSRLLRLLDESGFDFVSYDVPARWRMGMEVIARRR